MIPFIGTIAGRALYHFITAKGLQGASTFAAALPFGAGYSFGTYVGFPKNYQSSNTNKVPTYVMPYPQRKIRVWSSRYRRYVWVYPRRRYNNYSRRY